MTEVNSDQDKQALTITGVTVADSAALSANNIPAFWADPHWLLTWRHRTLEYHISEVSHRFPITVLLAERQVRRHQKAVDLNTGRVLGYARWHIPYEYATQADGTPTWPEAVVPAVSSEEEVDLQRAHDEVTSRWDPNMEPDVLFGPMREIKNEVIRNKTFMHLDYLAVHPDNQGKGIGTALVESGMIEAEKLGLNIFIHSMKAGVGLYKRLGFKAEKELVQDDSMFGGTGEYYVCMMTYTQKANLVGK